MSSNDTSSAVPPMVGLPQPWGVLMIGFWVLLILMGIVVVQTWNYYCSFPEDSKWIKLYVFCLFVADFLSSFFLMYWIYDLFIVNWGDPIPYGLIHWALASDPILGGVVGPMVHAFYAWCIHVISKTWWISATIMVFSLMALGGGIAGTHAARTLSTLAELANNVQLVTTFWLLPAAIADLIITITLTYYLRKHKGRFQQSDRILDKIIRLTIQNGLLTAFAAILDFIIYSAVATPYHIALTFILPKLYANTVLSSLNSRSAIRKVFIPQAVIRPIFS